MRSPRLQRAVSAVAVPLAAGGVLAASLIASAPASSAAVASNIYATGFATPAGLAFDSSGALYVSDYASNVITKVSLIYGEPTLTPIGSGFRYPLGVAVDAAKNVYVADYGNSRVEKIAADGTQTDVGSGYTYPAGVAVGASGELFVADVHDVVQVSAAGAKTTIASGFEFAQGIARDSLGNLFVTDTRNGVGYVARIDHVTHAVTTVASGLLRPLGVAIDPSGDLIVADNYASKVVRISGPGVVSTVSTGLTSPIGVAVTSMGAVLAGSQGDPTQKTGEIRQVGSSAAAPTVVMSALPAISQTTKLVPSWKSSAVASVGTVDVRYRSAAAGAALPTTYTSLARDSRELSANLVAATDTRYCFSVMSKTSIGAMSAWSAETCTNVPLDDRALVRSKPAAWSSTADAAALASTASSATVKGSSLTTSKPRKVASIALLGWTGPAAGTVDVYVGTKKVGSVSLKAATSRRTLLAPIKLAKALTGKVSLVVTSTGKQVKIDGIALS